MSIEISKIDKYIREADQNARKLLGRALSERNDDVTLVLRSREAHVYRNHPSSTNGLRRRSPFPQGKAEYLEASRNKRLPPLRGGEAPRKR